MVSDSLDALQVTALDTGVTTRVDWPLSGQSRVYPFVSRRAGFVVVSDLAQGPYEPRIGAAYFIDGRGSTSTRLGPASYAVASAASDRVWLITDDATPDQRLRQGVSFGEVRTVTEVDLAGNATTPILPLPGGRTVLGAVERGLLTLRNEGGSRFAEVWDPQSDQVLVRITAAGPPVAAAGDTFVEQPTDCDVGCPVRVHGLRSATTIAIPPPPGRTWASVALSADGRRLALLGMPPPSPADIGVSRFVPPRGSVAATVSVYDSATGLLVSDHATSAWKGDPTLAWSADGRWVLLAADVDAITYFVAGDGRSPAGSVPVPSAQDFLVLGREP